MTNRKISDLTALTAPVTGDLLPIVDISEAAAADKNKKITYGTFLSSVPLGTAAAPSIAFTGDNTGIYSPGADQLAIATGGTGRVFVDATGNVGVGLSNPSYPLEVAAPTDSTINIAGGTSNLCRLFFSDTALARGFLNYDHADDSLHIGTAASEKLRITSAGLVGIGTSSPGSLLHLADAGHITVGTTTGTKIGTATTQKIGFYNTTPVVQPAAVANATTAVDVITQLNDLLAKLRTLGIIAT